MNLNKVSSALYTAARLSRDLNAVSRGPAATGKRIVRKAVYPKAAGLLERALRSLWK